jgi:hypothetical protein
VSCVNYKVQNFTYYVSVPEGGFTSIDGINRAFDDAFESSKTKQRLYHMNPKNHDDVMNTISHVECGIRKCKPEWDSIWTKMCNEHDGFAKDTMMSCIVNALHPDYRDTLPNLEAVDLSPDAVFGEPFPDSFHKYLQQNDNDIEQNSQSFSRSLPPEFEELYQKNLQSLGDNCYNI